MTPERWVKIQEVFAAALEREPGERVAYLMSVCTDTSLRQEVELMIAAHEQGDSGFLEPAAAGSKEALKTGTRIGPYDVLAAIGSGGMGEVYRARDSKLGREVAIKILPTAFSHDPDRLVRFQREAKFLASLSHPNIASIYGLEDSGDTRALVMELVEGPTLADRIRIGPIPIDEALPIAKQICEALEYAHERGVVHRDLKPANIKISRDDSVKVLDFGLAKAVQGEVDATSAGDSPTLSEMATRAGVLLGTAAYMSPEQARAKPVDRRADIWAFGCVLYEMLSGKRAFQADSVTETLAAVLHNEPDWLLLPSTTAMRVRVLLHRCLQKDPKQRLRDIGDARISLDEVMSGAGEGVPGLAIATPAWRRFLPWQIASVTALGLAALAFIHLRDRPPAPAQLMRFQIAVPEKSVFVTEPSFSPDGRHLAFIAVTQEGLSQVWVRDLDSLESRPLIGTSTPVGLPIWSPDSHALAFQSESKLERINISGGPPQVICPVDLFLGGAWNSDGVIVFATGGALKKVSASGGEPSLLTKPVPSQSQYGIRYPSFLPDGRHFLYSAPATSTSSGTGIFLGTLDAGSEARPPKLLVAGWLAAYAPASGPGPGHILFLLPDGVLKAQAFDSSRLELEGDAVPVGEDVRIFSVSPNGALAYIEGNLIPLQLAWFNRHGKNLGTLGGPGLYSTPAISPDGRTVAATRPAEGGGQDLWLYDVARGTESRFTFDGKANIFPAWSPDGSSIAFHSTRQGIPKIYRKPANGIGQEEALEAPSGEDVPLDWSRDGRYLIEGVYDNSYQIWMLPLSARQEGGKSKPVRYLNDGFNEINAKLSPNGKWIAYDSDEHSRDEIVVRTFPNPSGKWQVSTDGGTRPVWSRDGKELYYIALDGNLMAVDVMSGLDGSFEGGSPKVLFNPRTNPLREDRFDVTKDGRFLIPTLTQKSALPITVVVNWEAALKR
jgi:serine/threonine protein kinase/Tol biopolymer transport system component